VVRWTLPVAIAVLLAVPASAEDQSVTARLTNSFEPAGVTIDVGEKVTWNNEGGFHNVHFDDGSFEQPASPSFDWETVERTFDTPGTFRYYCEQHGGPDGVGMSGTVGVRDATGTVPPPVKVEPGLTVGARDEQALQRLLGRGLRARARCVNGCDITLKLSLSPRTAKRLGFARRRVTIGKESDSMPVDQRVAFDIALKEKAEQKLADAERAFKVRLDVRATKDTTETARRKIKITP
jgi:plastocyanin